MPWELYIIAIIAVGFLVMLLWLAIRLLSPAKPALAPTATLTVAPTRLVTEVPVEPQPAIIPSAIAPEHPKCPHCAGQMNLRLVNQHTIWICHRFPRCNGARTKEADAV